MIVNVGSDITRNILAKLDTPILQEQPAIVYGLCTDNSFSCGYDKRFEHYITNYETRNISRYTGHGGVMYCENVHLVRVHFPYPYMLPMKFQREVLECIRDTCISEGLTNSHIIELNYLTVNNKKVIGCAWIHSADSPYTTIIISLNLNPFNFAAMNDAYLNKTLATLGDLSDENLPDNFIDTVASNIGSKFGIDPSGSLDTQLTTNLISIHNSHEWIVDGNRWW